MTNTPPQKLLQRAVTYPNCLICKRADVGGPVHRWTDFGGPFFHRLKRTFISSSQTPIFTHIPILRKALKSLSYESSSSDKSQESG